MARLSTELDHHFLRSERTEAVTLDEILNLAGERTFGFLIILLAFPSALPVPAPGYSTPFGVVLALLALQMLMGRTQPWLPARWRQQPFSRQTVQQILRVGLPYLRRIELLLKPRLLPICTSYSGRRVLSIAVLIMAISMIIPVPGTNSLPALGIFIVGAGLSEDDGLVALLGALGGLFITIIIWWLIIFLGFGLVDWLKSFF